jgi:hypothetical protein
MRVCVCVRVCVAGWVVAKTCFHEIACAHASIKPHIQRPQAQALPEHSGQALTNLRQFKFLEGVVVAEDLLAIPVAQEAERVHGRHTCSHLRVCA